jgi:hypothetical protein
MMRLPRITTRGLLMVIAWAGVALAAVVALLLRGALWSSGLRRSSWVGLLSLASLIIAFMLTGCWHARRREVLLELARQHGLDEGIYGRAEWAVDRHDFPPDVDKAAYHRRMRERYERAARSPWLTVNPGPAPREP